MNTNRFWYSPILLFACVIAASGSVQESVSADFPNIEWARQFGTSSGDGAEGVAVDEVGNIYVTGSSSGTLGNANLGSSDAYLSKFDSSGNQLWTKQFGSSQLDVGVRVALDYHGHVYVTGRTFGDFGLPNIGGFDGFLTKFDIDGNSLWRQRFGTTFDDYSSSLAADNLGNIYVAGRTRGNLASSSSGNFDAFIIKYDPIGSAIWRRQFGTEGYDDCFGVSADPNGNIYVVGSTQGSLDAPLSGNQDISLRKYNPAGNLVWGRQIGTDFWDKGFAVATDDVGNVYVTGWTAGNLAGSSTGNYDAVLFKYDALGNLVWKRQLGTVDYDYSFSISVVGDAVYLTGDRETALLPSSTVTGGDAFVAKYSTAGDLLWNLPFSSADGLEYGFDVAAAGSTAYVVGNTTGSLFGMNAGSNDVFLVKFAEVPEPASYTSLVVCAVVVLLRR